MELTTDYSFKGDETKFACTYDKLPTSVKPGSLILIADGSLVLRVTECLATCARRHLRRPRHPTLPAPTPLATTAAATIATAFSAALATPTPPLATAAATTAADHHHRQKPSSPPP